MAIFAVHYTYDTSPDRLEAVRPEHRQFLRGLHEDGTLLASGPWTGPTSPAPQDAEPPGALLLLRTGSAEEAAAILDDDPFRTHGLVVARTVRPWDPVIGPWRE